MPARRRCVPDIAGAGDVKGDVTELVEPDRNRVRRLAIDREVGGNQKRAFSFALDSYLNHCRGTVRRHLPSREVRSRVDDPYPYPGSTRQAARVPSGPPTLPVGVMSHCRGRSPPALARPPTGDPARKPAADVAGKISAGTRPEKVWQIMSGDRMRGRRRPPRSWIDGRTVTRCLISQTCR